MSSGNTVDVARIAAMLQQLRSAYLAELPERCEQIERLVLSAAASGSAAHSYDDLYRQIHSLKGSAGTHGIPFLSTVCHQFEDLLAQVGESGLREVADRCLLYVDLLKRGTDFARENRDTGPLEAALEALRSDFLHNRRPVLLVDSSAVQAGLCRSALESLPVQLTILADGIEALERLLQERFVLLIAGRTLKRLNGIALCSALRASDSVNRNIPVILLSADAKLPEMAHLAQVTAVIQRDAGLADILRTSVERLIGIADS
jgi:CheY-like chemotaxis protein/HPt (histidine-containing phosphotransfer) domain-containing protein